MTSLGPFLRLAHLLGLVLGVGGATAKLTLLIKARSDPTFVPAYLASARSLTRLIISGLALLTLSGIGWILVGYPMTPRLVTKLGFVAVIWVLGPVIDNVVEPRFRNLAPEAGQATSPAFLRAQSRYVWLEVVATGLFYVVVAMWVLT